MDLLYLLLNLSNLFLGLDNMDCILSYEQVREYSSIHKIGNKQTEQYKGKHRPYNCVYLHGLWIDFEVNLLEASALKIVSSCHDKGERLISFMGISLVCAVKSYISHSVYCVVCIVSSVREEQLVLVKVVEMVSHDGVSTLFASNAGYIDHRRTD